MPRPMADGFTAPSFCASTARSWRSDPTPRSPTAARVVGARERSDCRRPRRGRRAAERVRAVRGARRVAPAGDGGLLRVRDRRTAACWSRRTSSASSLRGARRRPCATGGRADRDVDPSAVAAAPPSRPGVAVGRCRSPGSPRGSPRTRCSPRRWWRPPLATGRWPAFSALTTVYFCASLTISMFALRLLARRPRRPAPAV